MMKSFSLIVSIMMISIYWLVPHQEALQMGLSTQSLMSDPWQTRMLYVMLHANLIHLTINVYCMLSLCFLADAKEWQFIVSLLVAWTIPSALVGNIPTLGMSAVNFALTGLIVMRSKKWWWLITINILLVASTAAIQGIAVLAHLYCLLIGATIGFILKPQFK